MLRGITAYRDAWRFMRQHQLLSYLIYPVIITFLVFWLGSWGIGQLSEYLSTWLATWLEIDAQDQAGWQEILYWTLYILMRVLLYIVLIFTAGSIVLVLLSPILTWLSEKVSVAMGNPETPFDVLQFFRDLQRAIIVAVRNGAIQLALSIALFFLGFIPIIGLLAPILMLFISAYFFGYSFVDYTLERHKYSVKDSNVFAWRHRTLVIGLGLPFAALLLIPVLGAFFAAIMAVVGTVAATLAIDAPGNITRQRS